MTDSETAEFDTDVTPFEGFTLIQAVAVGVNSTSPAYSLASILAPMALLVGYATPIVLIVSFIPMALTSLAFLYLNRRDSDCGTTFSWVSRALGAKPGFIAGWVVAATGVLIIGSVSQTAVEYGLLTIGLTSLAQSHVFVLAASTLLIIVMTFLSTLGSDWFGKFQTLIAFSQVAILLLFAAAAGLLAFNQGLPTFTNEWINPFSHGFSSLVAAMLFGVFAFWGWEAATNLSEECRKPADAGKAGALSTVVLLVTYVSVAVFVVMYIGRVGNRAVGESGLVLVDMSQSVLGPVAFLVLVAVFISALASTQSTIVPGSRALLSMARRDAIANWMGKIHPRFKTPWTALAVTGGLAAVWYLTVSLISAAALTDTLSAIGILVAFLYSITGIACVVFYREHITESLKGFLFVCVGPILGSVGLAFMLIVSIQSLWDPANSATGTAWLGLAPPLAIALGIFLLGVITMLIRARKHKTFFSTRPQVALPNQPPFVMPAERPFASGGILINCNASIDTINANIDEYAHMIDTSAELPVYLVFGIRPAEAEVGEEIDAVRSALITDAGATFSALHKRLKTLHHGSNIIDLYVDELADNSIKITTANYHPVVVI